MPIEPAVVESRKPSAVASTVSGPERADDGHGAHARCWPLSVGGRCQRAPRPAARGKHGGVHDVQHETDHEADRAGDEEVLGETGETHQLFDSEYAPGRFGGSCGGVRRPRRRPQAAGRCGESSVPSRWRRGCTRCHRCGRAAGWPCEWCPSTGHITVSSAPSIVQVVSLGGKSSWCSSQKGTFGGKTGSPAASWLAAAAAARTGARGRAGDGGSTSPACRMIKRDDRADDADQEEERQHADQLAPVGDDHGLEEGQDVGPGIRCQHHGPNPSGMERSCPRASARGRSMVRHRPRDRDGDRGAARPLPPDRYRPTAAHRPLPTDRCRPLCAQAINGPANDLSLCSSGGNPVTLIRGAHGNAVFMRGEH